MTQSKKYASIWSFLLLNNPTFTLNPLWYQAENHLLYEASCSICHLPWQPPARYHGNRTESAIVSLLRAGTLYPVYMYVCIYVKSLPHLMRRLQLRSESWVVTKTCRQKELQSSPYVGTKKNRLLITYTTGHGPPLYNRCIYTQSAPKIDSSNNRGPLKSYRNILLAFSRKATFRSPFLTLSTVGIHMKDT